MARSPVSASDSDGLLCVCVCLCPGSTNVEPVNLPKADEAVSPRARSDSDPVTPTERRKAAANPRAERSVGGGWGG